MESISACFKGQLISEYLFDMLNFPRKQRKIARISTLASKRGQIKKIKAIFIPNYKQSLNKDLLIHKKTEPEQ